MNILVDFQNTKGGAPRSQMAHAKALVELGHTVIAVVNPEEVGDFFSKTNFKIYYLAEFSIRRFKKNLFLINQYCRIIGKEKIDLIYSNRVAQCQFLSIVSDLSRVPIMNGRAGGFLTSTMTKVHNDKPYIVYSEENIDFFLKLGFSSNQLFLIRNRLLFPKVSKLHNKTQSKGLIITLTGSIKEETFRGILWFLQSFNRISYNNTHEIIINIAGDINLNKTSSEIFEQSLNTVQQKTPENIKIRHLNWIENITNLQAQSDICIGKGRSILEPAMMGKICFVISEDGYLYRCTTRNYKRLLYYNFSGRGKFERPEDGVQEFFAILDNKNIKQHYLDEAFLLITQIRLDYSIEYLPEKLKLVLNSSALKNQKFGKSRAIKKFVRFYALIIQRKIARNVKNN